MAKRDFPWFMELVLVFSICIACAGLMVVLFVAGLISKVLSWALRLLAFLLRNPWYPIIGLLMVAFYRNFL